MIAGSSCLLYFKHHKLWIHGDIRLLDVRGTLGITSNAKSSHEKYKFKNSNLHDIDEPHNQIRVNYSTDGDISRRNISISRKQDDELSNPNMPGDMHSHCGIVAPLFWLRDGIYGCIFGH